MTLRPCRRALSSPPRLSIVCLIKSWDYRPTLQSGIAPAIQSGVGHSGHQETGGPGASGKKRPSLGMDLQFAASAVGSHATVNDWPILMYN